MFDDGRSRRDPNRPFASGAPVSPLISVTSHSAQGLTADRVLINADMAVHPDLLSSRFAYVSVSRARLDAEIYTNRIEDLGPRLGADIGKSSAVEFSHSIGNSAKNELGTGQSI